MKNHTETDLSSYGKYRYYKKIRNRLGGYKTVPITRRLAIEYYCLECVGFIYSEMANCTMLGCPFFPYKFGTKPKGTSAKDRAKAIRSFCIKCVSDDREWIRECPSKLCPVHPFRLSGYKTDLTSLIPVKEVEILPEYEGGIVNLEAKITV